MKEYLTEVFCKKDWLGLFYKDEKYMMINPYKYHHPLDEISVPEKPYSVSYDWNENDDFSHFVNFTEDMLLEYFEGDVIQLILRKHKLKKLS